MQTEYGSTLTQASGLVRNGKIILIIYTLTDIVHGK